MGRVKLATACPKPRRRHKRRVFRWSSMKRTTKLRVLGRRRFPKGADESYLDVIRSMHCAVCRLQALRENGYEPTMAQLATILLQERSRTGRYFSEPDHVRTRGAAGPDRGNTYPAGRPRAAGGCGHHDERHVRGRTSHERRHRIDLDELAYELAVQVVA